MRPRFKLAKDTHVEISNTGSSDGTAHDEVQIVDGPHARQSGWVKATDLLDKGDGRPTTDLPVPDVHVLREERALNQEVPGPWREFRTLAKGTRVLPTTYRPGLPAMTPGQPEVKEVWVKVIDGPDTGAEGYLRKDVLTREQS
jgi:hypothetical protein